MKTKCTTWPLLGTSLLAVTLLTGCIAAIGNRDPESGQATLGQSLIDLKKAREAGALTDEEYEMQKARLLKH